MDGRALLMVQTVAAGFDIDAQEQALHRIDAAFAAARQRACRRMARQPHRPADRDRTAGVRGANPRAHEVGRGAVLADRHRAGRGHLLFAYRSVRVSGAGAASGV